MSSMLMSMSLCKCINVSPASCSVFMEERRYDFTRLEQENDRLASHDEIGSVHPIFINTANKLAGTVNQNNVNQWFKC